MDQKSFITHLINNNEKGKEGFFLGSNQHEEIVAGTEKHWFRNHPNLICKWFCFQNHSASNQIGGLQEEVFLEKVLSQPEIEKEISDFFCREASAFGKD